MIKKLPQEFLLVQPLNGLDPLDVPLGQEGVDLVHVPALGVVPAVVDESVHLSVLVLARGGPGEQTAAGHEIVQHHLAKSVIESRVKYVSKQLN